MPKMDALVFPATDASIKVDIQETDTGDGNFIWLVLINNKGNMLCFPENFFLVIGVKYFFKKMNFLYRIFDKKPDE